ncbi:hypothetical protein LCL96_04115 [Rossellomorea aquimaris]|uniref:DUF6941 family protein n=1 Tax=Rossellomorea aquimaris TaxID=189382 RepID=UPI001CD65151|nr:hypothetical protein [Rossellomorea aquimaris]MCA1058102.1 hypothetical protein [Rossellomorea aquimaris]
MIFPKYIFTCKDVTHHKDDTISYHNTFEELEVRDFPTNIEFHLVLGIEYSIPLKGNRKVSIRITDPQDNNVTDRDFVIELRPVVKEQRKFALNVIDIREFEIEEEGMYSILIYHNNELITSHEFMVSQGGLKIDANDNK